MPRNDCVSSVHLLLFDNANQRFHGLRIAIKNKAVGRVIRDNPHAVRSKMGHCGRELLGVRVVERDYLDVGSPPGTIQTVSSFRSKL